MEPKGAPENKPSRAKSAALWALSFVLMLAVAVYQRMTGPTYPMSAYAEVGGLKASGKLIRSHSTSSGAEVQIQADEGLNAVVKWRRFPTNDPFETLPMSRQGKTLSAKLPAFPAAAKIEYEVVLEAGGKQAPLNEKPAVLRYKDDVPAWTLVLHLICIFGGLLTGSRAFVGAAFGLPPRMGLLRWTVGFMALGGLVFGPIMQKHAFGAYWTGWPLGEDLTDTKTLLGIFVWVVAWIVASRRPQLMRLSVVIAFVAMLAVYLIPHSVRGSQYDWSKQQVTTGS